MGAYLCHLSGLVEDLSVKAVNRHRLKGYMLKWRNAKILLGCAHLHDLLKPASILCRDLQADEVSIVKAIEAILKTAKNMEKLKSTSFENLTTVKVILSRMKHEDNTFIYQGADLMEFEEAVTFFKANHPQYSDLVQASLRDHLATQETDLLSQALNILATQGWEKATCTSSPHSSAIEQLSIRFKVPLEQANINTSLLQEEWDKMTDYARQYLDLVTQDNNTVWWKLFNCTSAKIGVIFLV